MVEPAGLGCRAYGFRVQGFRGFGFRVEDFGFRGFRVWDLLGSCQRI